MSEKALLKMNERELLEVVVTRRLQLGDLYDIEEWIDSRRNMSSPERARERIEQKRLGFKNWRLFLATIGRELRNESGYDLIQIVRKFVDQADVDIDNLYDSGIPCESGGIIRGMCRNGSTFYFSTFGRSILITPEGNGVEIPDSSHAQKGEIFSKLTLATVLFLVLDTWLGDGPRSKIAGQFMFHLLEKAALNIRVRATNDFLSAVAVSECGEIIIAQAVVLVHEDGSFEVRHDIRPFQRHKILRISNLRQGVEVEQWPKNWFCALDEQKIYLFGGMTVFVTPAGFVPAEALTEESAQ